MKTVQNFLSKFFMCKFFVHVIFILAIGGGCVLTLKYSNLILSTKSTQTTAFSHGAIAF